MGIKKAHNVPPFVRYCSAIIPTMFDDSLSYYEALCALNNFLQTNVIDTINNNATVTEEYIRLTNELKEFVENYFDNLDVQEEINNKLDEMAEDGSLIALVKQYIDPIQNAYEAEVDAKLDAQDEAINGQTGRINIIESKVNTLGSGTPAGVYATVADLTSADPDHSKIYVVTADGKWYYYNSGWIAGGTYQSQGIGSNINWDNETLDLRNLQNISVENINTSDLDWEQGSISGANGQRTAATNRIRSNVAFQFTTSHVGVTLPNNYKISIFAYSDNLWHFVESTGWLTGITSFEVNTAYYYRFLISHTDDSTITADAYSDIEIFNAENNIIADVDDLKSRVNTLEQPIEFNRLSTDLHSNILNVKEKELRDCISWEQGSLNSTTGGLVTSTTRLRTVGTFRFNNKTVKFNAESGYKYNIFAYSDAIQISNKYVERAESDWITGSYTLTTNDNYFYRVIVAKNDDSDILVSDISNLSIKEAFNENRDGISNLVSSANNQPKLICHRGMTCIRSENTLPAYEVCGRYGIKYVKCDIQVTSDGHYVCSHQDRMQYPFVTPADNAYISSLTLNDIQNNYYISGPMFDTPYNHELRMPSFEQALVCFRENNIIPMLDMKTGTDYQAVYDILVKYGFKENIILFTARTEVLNGFYAIDPNVKLILWGRYSDAKMTYLLKFKNANVGFATDYEDLSTDRVQWMHEHGIEVATYSINDYSDIQNAIDMGVDYIQSDNCQFGLVSQLSPLNLEYTQTGTGDYELIIPDSSANIFVDYVQLDIEVFYRSGYSLSITIGEKEYIDNKPGMWHKIKLQKIKLNGGLNINITCTDPDFMWIDRKVTLFTSKQG